MANCEGPHNESPRWGSGYNQIFVLLGARASRAVLADALADHCGLLGGHLGPNWLPRHGEVLQTDLILVSFLTSQMIPFVDLLWE